MISIEERTLMLQTFSNSSKTKCLWHARHS